MSSADGALLKIVGYVPVYAPPSGSIVTQAFILCTLCKRAISTNGGPGPRSVLCPSCVTELLRRDAVGSEHPLT